MTEIITVRNAGDEPETAAEILIRNKLDFQPKISVIIPVYNVEKYLRQCLESVLNQTLKEIEVICVDDGSTDGSLHILQEYAAKDKRITVLTQKNLYAGIARNAGLAVAQGEYVHFLDSDDFFEAQMLEKMIQVAQEDKSDAVVCGFYYFDDVTQKDDKKSFTVNKLSLFSPRQDGMSLIKINPAPWNKLFKTSLFRKYDIRFENLQSCNDLTAVFSALAAADKISVVKELFVHYRANAKGNTSSNRGRSANCIWYALDRLERNFYRLKCREVFEDFLVSLSVCCLRYETAHCNAEQQRQLKQAMPEVLSEKLYKGVMKLYAAKEKQETRRYYLFGIPLVKVIEK